MVVHEERRAWFCIADIWRTDKDVGEAFTMLTILKTLPSGALAVQRWANPGIKSIPVELPVGGVVPSHQLGDFEHTQGR
jgi:hypothetical protein